MGARLVIGATCVVSALAGASAVAAKPPSRFEFTEAHMGMPFKLTFYAADEDLAQRAAKAAFERIAELDRTLSDYKPESELSRLSAGAPHERPVPVSDDLFRVLERSQRLAARSDGAFDVTVGPLVRLWRRARRQKELPEPARLAEARAAVGYRHLELDATNHTARLTKPGMRLDLGGIGAGYAVDAALAVFRERGITRAMVEASGDIGVGEPPPGAAGWRIGLGPFDAAEGPPSRFVLLANAALATSGDLWQFVELDGRRYSHIVDPRTGLGLTDRSTVTVISPDCTTADSLATAVSVLGPQSGLRLVEETPGAAALIVRMPAGKVEVHESKRVGDYARQSPGARPGSAP
jgi:thiamine biosynthesis lipoprotein